MLRVGITGGIGSGKSTVASVFEQLGIAIYKADERAKLLYSENKALKKQLVDWLGKEVYHLNGTINRELLSKKVFSNQYDLEKLNAMIHPLVFEDYEKWCTNHQKDAYTIKEAAIVFESGSYKRLHLVIGVAAPMELRVSRVMERDGVSAETVHAKMRKQMPQEELLSRCQEVIINDGNHSLIDQVLTLHRKIKGLALSGVKNMLLGNEEN